MGLHTHMLQNAPNSYLEFMFPHTSMLLLFVFTFSAIIAWAFIRKYLNPLIDATLAILGCALETMVTFIMLPISWTAKKIDTYIVQPIENLKKRFHIHIPMLVKACFYALIGIGLFLLDHRYSTGLFANDETFIMYPMEINGIKFWVSEYALWGGGLFLGMSSIILLNEILKTLNRLLDRTIHLNIIVYR